MLAAVKLTNTNATAVYTCPANKQAHVTVNALALADGAISIALTNGAAPTDANWIEKGLTLKSSDVLERTQIVLTAGQKIYAQTDAANAFTVQAYGFEEAA